MGLFDLLTPPPDWRLVRIADYCILRVQALTGAPKYRQCIQLWILYLVVGTSCSVSIGASILNMLVIGVVDTYSTGSSIRRNIELWKPEQGTADDSGLVVLNEEARTMAMFLVRSVVLAFTSVMLIAMACSALSITHSIA